MQTEEAKSTNEPCGNEVIETVDLAFFSTGKMPLFTKLASSADIGDSENGTVALEESEDRRTEEGVDGDSETTVTCRRRSQLEYGIRRPGNLPYWMAGAVPSNLVSLCLTMNIGTLVPSLLLYQTYTNNGQDFGWIVLRGEIYLVGEEVVWVQAVDKGLSVDTPSLVVCLPEVILSDNTRGRESDQSSEEPFVRATSR